MSASEIGAGASWRTRDTTVRSEATPGWETNIGHTFLVEVPQ
ncbi:MAG: hypothetical protein ABI275_01245 [Terrimesophilobacter sp.]